MIFTSPSPLASQRDGPDRLRPRQFKGGGPGPTPDGGRGGPIYDLDSDVVCKVDTRLIRSPLPTADFPRDQGRRPPGAG
jgi:hypothetical protein